MAAVGKKTLIGFQATEDEVVRLDEHWKNQGAQSRSLFLRELVERELSGQGPVQTPPVATPQQVPTTAPPEPPEPPPDLRRELAALGYVLLACLQKCETSEAAKGLIQKFYLSGVAAQQIQNEGGN